MRLFDEIFKNAEGNALQLCSVVPRGGGYFQGVKGVGDFSPERIVLCFARCEVEVEGERLSIDKYCDGDLRLSGEIFALRMGEKRSGGR